MNKETRNAVEHTTQRVAATHHFYAAFELLAMHGHVGTIAARTGFVISNFQKWREEGLSGLTRPVVLWGPGAGVLDSEMVETAAYCLEARA